MVSGSVLKKSMEQVGKTMVVIGLIIAALGALAWLGVFRWLRLGRLPGDIAVERPGFSFYFPITTMILLSIAIMLVSWLVGSLRR
jgi:hypothetical protein